MKKKFSAIPDCRIKKIFVIKIVINSELCIASVKFSSCLQCSG